MRRTEGSRLVAAAAAIAVVLAAVPCDAARWRRAKPPAWRVVVEAVTDFPIDLGGRLAVEAPYRIRLATTFGVVPDAYVDAMDAIIRAAGGYSDETGAIVSSALESSFIWRIQGGWRPLAERGLYVELGYALATLGAGIDGQLLFDAAVTVALPPDAPVSDYVRRRYELDSMLHMLTVEVGWEWVVADAWVFRVGAGAAATVASSSSLGYRGTARAPLREDALSEAYAAWLDDVYTSVLFTPVVTASIGLKLY